MMCIVIKTAQILLIVYLIVLYAYVIPSHVHNDLLEHDGCVLCQCAHLPVIPVYTYALAFFLIVTILTFLFFSTSRPHYDIPSYSTRAPPHRIFF